MWMSCKSQIAIVGAGLGGLTAAALFQRAGLQVTVFEQAPAFARLGAGIHLGPNVMKVMRGIDTEEELKRIGSQPEFWYSRDWRTGSREATIPLGQSPQLYGAPYL